VLSFTAQYYLVMRFVQSWHLWVAVDIIYVPLYASRGLYVTAVLYAILLILAFRGLKNFQRQYEANQALPD
jgi:nicotinamide mononucleotide transporter